MNISVQISYYPLGAKNFKGVINSFIGELKKEDIEIKYSTMSTTIYGKEKKVFKIIQNLVDTYFKKYNSILDIKISNSCPKI